MPVLVNPPTTPPRRRRILFFAEAATLAHVVRPWVLAQSLDRDEYEVTLAVDPRYNHLLEPDRVAMIPLHSIPSAQFLHALARGTPVYDAATLEEYIEEDLRLIAQYQPDLVVGDFRISLAVSATLNHIPYLTLTNAYWSPYSAAPWPLPENPFVRWLGVSTAGVMFRLLRPLILAPHCRAMNRVLQAHGLPSLGNNMREVYTHADHVLYADVPGWTPMHPLPPNHHYLGPIAWAPHIPLPDWWDRLPTDRPVVYANLGSSGPGGLLPTVLAALADMPLTIVAATAGHPLPGNVPVNAYLANYLPGDQVAARASLVICNGGSPTTQQALAAGKPVLALPANMDQYLNMQGLVTTGAVAMCRSGQATPARLRPLVESMLATPAYTAAAQRCAAELGSHDAVARFQQVIRASFENFPSAPEATNASASILHVNTR